MRAADGSPPLDRPGGATAGRSVRRGAAALALVVFAVFLPTVTHDFVNFDDDLYVTGNLPVRDGLTLRGLAWSFSSTEDSNWHPLAWLSHMLDVELFGLWAGGHHLTNVLLHAATTVALFRVLASMTSSLGRSLLVALLFGVHPLHVESVAWVSERKGLLCGLFWVLALAAYLAYVRKPGWRRLLPVVGAVALGGLSKPAIVTLPFVLLLLDYWPLGRIPHRRAAGWRGGLPARLLLEKVPLFAIVVADSIVTYGYQRDSGATTALEALPFLARLANAFHAYAGYLGTMLLPRDLAVFYPHAGADVPGGPAVLAAALLLAVSVAAVAVSRFRGYPVTSWAWYLGTLIPVIGLVQVGRQSMADRYTYVPLIGPLLGAVWGLADGLRVFTPARRMRLAVPAAGLAVCALAFAARSQVRHWQDSESLFRHALAATTENALAHHNLACALRDRGDLAGAERHFREALRLRPGYAQALFNLGFIHFDRGELEQAADAFLRGLAEEPRFVQARVGAGFALGGLGRHAESVRHFRAALADNPHEVFAWKGLGAGLQALGEAEEAERALLKALDLAPGDGETLYQLGMLALARGRPREAVGYLSRLAAVDPDNIRTRLALARARAAAALTAPPRDPTPR